MKKLASSEKMERQILEWKEHIARYREADSSAGIPKEDYRIVLDEIEDGYYENDLSGKLVFFNRAFCKIYGYAPDEILVTPLDAFFGDWKEKKREIIRLYKEVYATGIPRQGIVHEILRKDGTKRVVENSVALKRDSEGRPVGFRTILRDITERVRAEEELGKQRGRLEAIFRSVDDAIITVDTGMRVIEANDAAERICCLNTKEMTGKPFSECLTKCQSSCFDALREVLEKKVTIRERRIECHDLRRQIALVNISPLIDQDGGFLGAVLVIRDVTRLKELERELEERHQFHNMLGQSEAMRKVYRLIERLVDLETTVLITGETGTGKELVAQALHYSGSRAQKPFVKVNCSALAENLLESELFGHAKGAFTGAIRDRQGRFEAAEGGTILLDEIGDISPRIQLKLLRMLQEKECERVGDSTPIRLDVRVISCTHQNLKEKVRRGEFREDLYYRMKVVEIPLPALRERREDIPLLVRHFCGVFNRKFKKNIEGLSEGALKCLLNYSWRGNVRELEHVIERAFVLCGGQTISIEDLPAEVTGYVEARHSLFEREGHRVESTDDISAALEKAGGNKAKAARLLGISRQTLYRKLSNSRMTPRKEV